MKKKISEFFPIDDNNIINIAEIKAVKRSGDSTIIHKYANTAFGHETITIQDELAVKWKILQRLLLTDDLI